MNRIRKSLDMHGPAEGRSVTRREILTTAAAVVGASSVLAGLPRAASGQVGKVVKKGRIKQSICRGCLRKLKLSREEEAARAAKMGLVGLDLVGRGDWDAVKKHGLVATTRKTRGEDIDAACGQLAGKVSDRVRNRLSEKRRRMATA